MRIDPGNKCFIAVFAVFAIGVIGFFIASIFLKVGGDIEIKTFEFKNSNFTVSVKQFKDDKRYAAQVYNGKIRTLRYYLQITYHSSKKIKTAGYCKV